jgi:hypothetical protein
MGTYEVCWKLDGTATVEAASMADAIKVAERELGAWTGAGLDDVDISIDGVEVFD